MQKSASQVGKTRGHAQLVTPHRDTALMLDLVLPLQCGGCGAPSTKWCQACDNDLTVRLDQPHLVTPRLDPGVPVFSLGRYAGARRQTIVAVKEHGRADLIEPLANALRTALRHLLEWGMLDTPLTIVPAPTRMTAARRRGGDPVSRTAALAIAHEPRIRVVSALLMRAWVKDSVGLSSAARQRNIAGRIRLRRRVEGDVLLIDDIVTTGATACESVRILHASSARVAAVLALANA